VTADGLQPSLTTPDDGPALSWRDTFSPFRQRAFRYFWAGYAVTVGGDWMDVVAFNWLVLELGDDPLWLAAAALARGAPALLLSFGGGVVADLRGRRQVLLAAQLIGFVLAFLLATLVATEVVELWQVILIAVGRGCLMAFSLPARMTATSDLVPENRLRSAIALMSSTETASRVAGAGIAAALLALFGLAEVFYVNAASFLVALACFRLVPEPARRTVSGIRSSLVAGARFVLERPLILQLVLLGMVPALLAQPFLPLLAVFVRDWGDGAATLGVLTAITAAGAVAGGLAVAVSVHGKARPWAMTAALVVYGLSVALFTRTDGPWAATPVLALAGACMAAFNASNFGLVQALTPLEYRGRVVSLLFVQFAMLPLGVAAISLLGREFGIDDVLGVTALVMAGLGLLAAPLVQRATVAVKRVEAGQPLEAAAR
jgi:MFS family permease